MKHFEQLSQTTRRRMQRYVELCQSYVAEYLVISVEPLILYLPIMTNLSYFVNNYRFLFNSLKDRKIYVICCTHWYFEREKDIAALTNLLEKYEKELPEFTFFILSNTSNQLKLFEKNNIKSILCSSNSMIDESLYFPIARAEKRCDAVYDGRLVDWKRHKLAAAVENLGLIYYAIPWLEDNYYIEDIKSKFSGALFFNHSASGEYRKLTPSEVNLCLNECRVGLCLSEEEGAMYASIQYLLAGLPVVTTPSRGGRDEFFDPEYVLTVEPTTAAVARGVKELIERNLSAESIRQKTLAKMAEHRGRFVELGAEIYAAENCERSFADDFKKVFSNRLLKQLNHNVTLDLLSSNKFN